MAAEHDAFISYSHGADGKLAKALEEGIEQLAKPLLRLRACDVFRDETSLAANPSLWTGILDHLSNSGWFILLACPESANSAWCTKEIVYWLENRSLERMLIVWTAGDLVWKPGNQDFDWTASTCLNSALRGKFKDEPLYVDLRWARQRERLTLTDVKFRDAVLNLAAPIRSLRKDELDGADVRQLRRNRVLVRMGVTAIAIAGAVAVWQAIVARRERDEAVRQARIALSRGLSATAQQKLPSNPDQSLLLATHATQLDAGPRARSALLAALQAHPRLLRVARTAVARNYAGDFSPDGRLFASTDDAGRISLWDTATWRLVREIPEAHQQPIWALAFVPDGTQLVTASLDKTVAVWDVQTGARVGAKMSGHHNEVLCAAISPDGRVIASGDLDGTIRMWDRSGQRQLRAMAGAHADGVRSLVFSPDGKKFVSGGFDGRIRVWDAASGNPQPGPAGAAHRGAVMRMAFRKDGGWLASSGADGVVRFWDGATWKEAAKPFGGFNEEVSGLSFSPDGRQLAAGSWDNSVRLWNLGPEDEITTKIFRYHSNQVWQVAFSPDGKTLASASWDGRVALWDTNGLASFRQELDGYTDEAFVLAFSPGGEVVAIGDEKGRVYLHGAPDGAKPLQDRCDEKDGVTALRFDGSGSMLACGGADGTVMMWDTQDDRPLKWKKNWGNSLVRGLVFTPDRKKLVSSQGAAVMQWDISSGDPVRFPVQGPLLGPVAFSPDWKYFVSGRQGGDIVLWDAITGQQNRVLVKGSGEHSRLDAVTFSPDGSKLAASAGPRQYVWNVGKWDSYDTYTAGNATDIGFGSDSRILAVASHGEGIRLLDVESKEQFAEPLRGPRSANRIVFSQQGMRLAASFGGGFPPMIWDLDLNRMMEWACRIASRDLTAVEWRELAGPLPQPRICPDGQESARKR